MFFGVYLTTNRDGEEREGYVLDLRELGNSKGKGYVESTEVRVDDYIVHT
jgi:hypothetical protein